jgi:hypothetical protein
MIRAAITCPIPGTVVSSFSVAVLMSILPKWRVCFGCDLFGLGVSPGAVCAGGLGVDENEGEAADVPSPGGFWLELK